MGECGRLAYNNVMSFDQRYQNLNDAQRRAVDTIDGPVMVIAGPGTGKTELLSMRVANILRRTDTLPENILCLTYTDSGVTAMRSRLIEIIGPAAYKVAIHTFHSFGSDTISQHREFFYNGASFRPADSISTYEILRGLVKELPLSDPLASSMNDEYTFQSDIKKAISELKRSGLTSSELLAILDQNDETLDIVGRELDPIIDQRISPKIIDHLQQVLSRLQQLPTLPRLYEVPTLQQVMIDRLESAVDDAVALGNKTAPITAWKKATFEKDGRNQLVLKARRQQRRLRSVAVLYERYMAEMQKSELYDYDDMILQVVHAMEVHDDLRFNLQEKYQYLLVDEFQDTNLAQMRILHNLTNNPVNEDRPNIFIVGDDNQAIYSFQGADISNILNFSSTYPNAETIVLTENYRSTQAVLDSARTIIQQGDDRLEQRLDHITKQLNSRSSAESVQPRLVELSSAASERAWIVDQIVTTIDRGTPANQIAVLFHHHRDIESILPYFSTKGVAVRYERRDNVLELAPIVMLEKVGRLIVALADSHHDTANGLLPEILSHPAWAIPASTLWKLSTTAYDQRRRWLDVMESFPELTDLRSWIIELVADASLTPLEHMIDRIIGVPGYDQTDFVSPLYDYFFNPTDRGDHPDDFLRFIEALRIVRTRLIDYRPTEPSTLASFVSFIDLHRRIGDRIQLVTLSGQTDSAVQLMTAHGAKGLEFDTVFVANVTDTEWGERVRSRPRLISYPDNLLLAAEEQSLNERLRLFYVALTRARHQLTISYSVTDDKQRTTLPASFLLASGLAATPVDQASDLRVVGSTATIEWYQSVITPPSDLRTALAPRLESYRLSASHLNAFIDVRYGGPQYFLVSQLLRFPRAGNPHTSYGLAVHRTLEQAHTHFVVHGVAKPIEDSLIDFQTSLGTFRLEQIDYDAYLQKGNDELSAYLSGRVGSFSKRQKPELDFSHQQSTFGDVHLTGSLDLADIDTSEKLITVYDYKTGRPATSWQGRTDNEKIKLYKYRQQLLFYKLLVEQSRDYGSYSVRRGVLDFVEPLASGQLSQLEAEFTSDEFERFTALVQAIWRHITTLDMPDTSSYEPTLKGIIAFEDDLIAGRL